jgi:hypothetical protein
MFLVCSSLFALDADDRGRPRDRLAREAAEFSPAWSHSTPPAPRATTRFVILVCLAPTLAFKSN